MYKLLILSLILSLFTSPALFANKKAGFISETIDVSRFDPTPLEIKKSLLRVIIEKNWEINNHTRNSLEISYKERTVKITTNETGITIETIKDKTSKPSALINWIATLKAHFLNDLEYYYHVRKAESMLKN